MRLAIFDIDGVLVKSSSERAFWRYLLWHRRQGPRQGLAYALSFLRYLPFAGIHTAKVNKSYLTGISRSELEALGNRFIEAWAGDSWVPAAVGRLREHQQSGDTVVLLSGTLEQLARPLAELLDVHYVIATLLSQRDGFIQSKPPVIHPFAAAKLAIGDKLVREFGLDWEDVSAYGDSYYDLPLLEAAGEPVAVRPDSRLRRIAFEKGWEIIGSRETDDAHSREKMTRRA